DLSTKPAIVIKPHKHDVLCVVPDVDDQPAIVQFLDKNIREEVDHIVTEHVHQVCTCQFTSEPRPNLVKYPKEHEYAGAGESKRQDTIGDWKSPQWEIEKLAGCSM